MFDGRTDAQPAASRGHPDRSVTAVRLTDQRVLNAGHRRFLQVLWELRIQSAQETGQLEAPRLRRRPSLHEPDARRLALSAVQLRSQLLSELVAEEHQSVVQGAWCGHDG